jgi:predicted ATP-dependent endonuclease of OLD family
MRIAYVEIANFRKLHSVRIDFAEKQTLFVGANNSGKTSAMLALRRFLAGDEGFVTNDFTLSNWRAINRIGTQWEAAKSAGTVEPPKLEDWTRVLPSLDLWLQVPRDEVHYVSRLIPTLDWDGGLLGVRLRLEPEDVAVVRDEYLAAIGDIEATKSAASKSGDGTDPGVRLWPESMIAFLDKKLATRFTVRTYALDPTKCKPPQNGQAQRQALSAEAQSIEGTPLRGLIRINEIHAQRGFGHAPNKDESKDGHSGRDSRRLSDQFRNYYSTHLDPLNKPGPEDLDALKAIGSAQRAFDDRLEASFKEPLKEVYDLGYPGMTDPRLAISTRVKPMDSLNHDAAVQYEIDTATAEAGGPKLRLPEDQNGLGYQNLISMSFRLMSFRDAWMRVGKAGKRPAERNDAIEPLHLVLVEEPEAYLHAQVQQVFINKAYEILRNNPNLGANTRLATQLVVSTHSSHVAHETPFAALRYFRRLPAGMGSDVPVSTVVSLMEVFGSPDETQLFVIRYLTSQHSDLFFADAAILVEGTAERMLVPHFMKRSCPFLNRCYISLLEIGGSHAHTLTRLIEHLGLLTLVITDVDAGNGIDKKAECPKRGAKQVTNNATLKTWAPKLETIDGLLDAAAEAKEIVRDRDPLYAVRVAYQVPISVTINKQHREALASTFEDSLVFANLDLFSTMKGGGLIRKFREAIAANQEPESLGQAMFESLREARKAEFALDVMAADSFEKLKAPDYIDEGLKWLELRLRKKEAETIPALPPKGGGA